MSEVAALEIKVTSDKVDLASRRLGDLARHGAGAERAAGSLTKSFAGMIGPLVGVGTAIAGLSKLVSVTREFEKLNAGLITATGSAESAAIAFGALEDFGAKTPYSLNQSVEAFTKLVNLGLNPSEKALTSYGNTAASMGKDLNQMIEAVADASVGQFERLKEFGIKASSEGDKVTFRFRGVTTTVKKSAEEIEGYLIKLGETNFGGAMAERMKTLDGAISNLGDAWDKLFREIGKGDVGGLIKDAVTVATDALTALTGFLNSGQLGAGIDKLHKMVMRMAADADLAFSSAKWLALATVSPAAGLGGSESPGDAYRRTRDLLASAEMDIDRERASAARTAAYDAERTRFLSSGAAIYGGGSGLASSLPGAYAAFAPQARAAAMASKAKKGKGYEVPLVRGEDSDFAKAASDRDKELQAAIDKEAKLSELELKRQQDEKRAAEQRSQARDALYEGLMTEEEILAQSYERKRKMAEEALAEDLIGAEEHAILRAKIDADYAKKKAAADSALIEQSTANAKMLFGSMADIARGSAGEQSSAYKALFAMSKAFAVAEATVKIGQSIASAYSLGWPLGIPAGIAAAAQGAQVLAMIQGANYSGAFDRGGNIPAGSFGIVGEYGPEFVRGPAQVTSRQDTARALQQPQTVKVVVAPDMAAAEQFLSTPAGERLVMAIARRNSTVIKRF